MPVAVIIISFNTGVTLGGVVHAPSFSGRPFTGLSIVFSILYCQSDLANSAYVSKTKFLSLFK